MSRLAVILCALPLAYGVEASWYWPFGSSDDDGSEPPRISELMKPASLLIDEASDLAGDGKVDESVEKYRRALDELDRIERENPERAKGTEFATLRNKRAYVNAAIDSMLLSQVQQNARAVAVSDTTELERRLAEERNGVGTSAARQSGLREGERPAEVAKDAGSSGPSKPSARRELAMDAIARGDYSAAEDMIGEMLREKPDGAMALNLRAAMEMKRGKLDVAEKTLEQAIMSNPRSYSAYYNLAMLLLQRDAGNKAGARRYYEAGRSMGGPVNEDLEGLVK